MPEWGQTESVSGVLAGTPGRNTRNSIADSHRKRRAASRSTDQLQASKLAVRATDNGVAELAEKAEERLNARGAVGYIGRGSETGEESSQPGRVLVEEKVTAQSEREVQPRGEPKP